MKRFRVFLRANNKPITQFDISELFGRAYLKIQSGSNAVKDFQITGIYLVNRHVFDETDFLAAQQKKAGSDNKMEDERDVRQNAPNLEQGKKNLVYPVDIVPLPVLKKKIGSRDRKPSKCKVTTASPYIKELELSLRASEKNLKKAKRQVLDRDTKFG